MKKATLILMLSLMAVWTSKTMAQQPIYDPFFEIVTLVLKAGYRGLIPDGKGIMFKDYQYVLPAYRLDITVNISPAYHIPPGVGIEKISISAVIVIEDKASDQYSFIMARGGGIGKTWMEYDWEYEITKITSDFRVTTSIVSEDVAKEAAKKFLDLWHGRISIAPKDIPKIFH